MKDAVERITNKGNSSLLLQLAEKVGSVAVAPATLSENVVAMTRINTPEEKAPVRVAPQREVTGLTQRINKDDDFYIKNQSTEVILMKANVCNDPDINRLTDNYAELCELAHPYGLNLSIEPMP